MRLNSNYIRGIAVMLSSGFLPPAYAQSSATPETSTEELTDRIAELEARQSDRLRFGSALGTTVELYGYIKADFLFDLDTDLGTTTFGLGSLTPGGFTGDNFRAQAIQSRIGVRTKTQTELGELGVQIEGDFFGSGGGGFRLRHANVTLGPWLVGRSWTNFMPLNAYPGTLDFQGPAGIPFARNTQLRYTHDFNNGLMGSVAIENPAGNSSDPILTGALAYKADRFFLRAAVIGGTVEGPVNRADTLGWTLSGTADLWNGGGVNATYTIGDAIGSYMVFGGADTFNVGGVDRAVEASGYTIGLTHDFNDKFGFAAAYGHRENNIGALTGTQSLETVHVTFTYKPVENVTAGLEFITGERTLFNSTRVSADRVQASVQVSF